MSDLYSTLYSTPDRVVLAIWCSICLLAGLIGNTLTFTTFLLLIPTSRVDRFTTIILRHLAVSDIFYILTRILPSLISHVMGGWILGEKVCTVEGYVYFIPIVAGMALVLCLSIAKVYVCLQPLRAHRVNSTAATVVSVVIWAQAVLPIVVALSGRVKVEVSSELETICEMKLNQGVSLEYSVGIMKNIQIWVPTLLIVPCNVLLWYLVRRHTQTRNLSSRKAVTTILSISLLFIISWIPTVVEEAWRVFAEDPQIPLWFNKVHINFYFISSFGNPIIYVLINKRYRKEIVRKISVLQLSSQNAEGGNQRTLSPGRRPTRASALGPLS